MKKKISVFALLLSLMITLFVPVSVSAATETTADDVKYANVEDYMHSMGYTDFVSVDNAVYMVFIDDAELYVLQVKDIASYTPSIFYAPSKTDFHLFVVGTKSSISANRYVYYSPKKASLNNNFSIIENGGYSYNGFKCSYMGGNRGVIGVGSNNKSVTVFNNLVYSDLDIYLSDTTASNNFTFNREGEIIFESTRFDSYSFRVWCQDAGLNCLASTNESPTKIPYSYNSYWHIVRKTANGKWLLTTIGNSVMQENIADYRLLVGENGNLHVASIYSGDDVNGYKLNVRQYEYDTDGWKVRTYETLDTRDSSGIVDLGAGSGFDDTRVLAYTSESIYDYNGSVPLYEKSTEYFDVTNTPGTPDTPDEPDSPTSTPSNPNGGSGSEGGGTGGGTRPESPDIGGDVESGGGLDFIISLFTKIWTDICSVEMSVDGYSISLQQIFVYGALVSIVGGFIMHFIFGRK